MFKMSNIFLFHNCWDRWHLFCLKETSLVL